MESQLIEELLGLLQKMNEERGVPEGESLEDKNILQGNSPSNPNKKISPLLNSNERRRTSEIATIFAKSFGEYTKKYKKDEKPKTLISQTRGRLSSPPPLPEKKSGMSIMSMVLAGLALLGASIGGIVASLTGFFGNGAVAGFVTAIGKVGMIGALKILAKTFLKKFTLGVLKKLPIIGGIISLTQAVMAFKDGDIFKGIGYLISGLLNFIPIVGPWLSIGADLLIAWAEGKGMFDEGGALSPANGWKTIKGWMSTIGKTIMDNALYLPIIGGFKRFGMAYDAFASGNIMDGIKELGLGLITFIGGGPIIAGIEMLMGFFGDKVKDVGNLKSNSSWYNKLGEWIYKKLGDMPYWIRKPLEWFGIIESTSEDPTVWASIKSATSGGMSGIIDFVSNSWGAVKEMAGVGIDFIKEGSAGIIDGVKSMFSKVSEGFENITKSVGNWIGKFNPFGGGDKSKGGKKGGLSDSQKEARAKAAGYSSWEEYEKSGWKWKSGNATVDKAVKSGNATVDKAVKSGNATVDKAVKSSSNTNEEKAKAAGHSSWEEYKASGWKWKSAGIASVVQEGKPESINHLQEAAKIQIKLLGEISHWGKLSLMELKRMSGNGGGGNVSVNASMTQPQENSLVTLGDNRGGYAASPYALS